MTRQPCRSERRPAGVGPDAALSITVGGWCVALLVASPAGAQDFTIDGVRLRDGVLLVDGSTSLAPVDRAIREGADAELRRSAPGLFGELDVGVLRYRNTTAQVTAVGFEISSDPRELLVVVTTELHADRERRGIHDWRLVWNPDGREHMATVVGWFRVGIAFDASGLALVTLRVDRFTTTLVTEALRGLTIAVPAGRDLARRSVEIAAVRDRGLRATDAVVTSITDGTLHFTLTTVEAS